VGAQLDFRGPCPVVEGSEDFGLHVAGGFDEARFKLVKVVLGGGPFVLVGHEDSSVFTKGASDAPRINSRTLTVLESIGISGSQPPYCTSDNTYYVALWGSGLL